MSWITWTTLAVAWPLLGLGAAYLFGRFTHGAEIWGDASDLKPSAVSYFRRVKRAKASSRAYDRARPHKAAGARRSH